MDTCKNLPVKLLDRWKAMYDQNGYEKLLQALQDKPIPAFRVNTIKTTASLVEKELTKLEFEIEKVSWYPDAYVLKNKSVRELTETAAYKKGFLYIQNLSSMIPALVLDPKPGDKILDIAAAPGSKTTQIAALMQNTGELTANDISFKRLFKLKENINRMGVTNTKVLNLSGESFWKKLPEYFDKTLVDVPCSMEGRIRCDDPKTYTDWSANKIKKLSLLQKYLLRSAVSATKVGGTIVYATCTLAPEENEEVLEWVVEKTPLALTVEKIVIPNLPLQHGFTSWKNKTFKHTSQCARILPTQTMEGFFIAKLRKTKTTLP
jgi:NOL1/NOP2/sun family putative RNA methylase